MYYYDIVLVMEDDSDIYFCYSDNSSDFLDFDSLEREAFDTYAMSSSSSLK